MKTEEGNPHKIQDYIAKVNNFLTSVDTTLLRFRDHGFAVKEFNLSMMFYDPQSMPTRIDHWMTIVSESGVKVLKLKLELQLEDRDVGLDSLDKH